MVDDEPDIRRLLEHRLKASGFRVSLARDGHQGLRKAEKERPDLILLDVKMPGLPGDDAARRLRQNPLTQGIPIIFLTAGVDEDQEGELRKAPADEIIAKPFAASTLIEAINRVIKTAVASPQEKYPSKEA